MVWFFSHSLEKRLGCFRVKTTDESRWQSYNIDLTLRYRLSPLQAFEDIKAVRWHSSTGLFQLVWTKIKCGQFSCHFIFLKPINWLERDETRIINDFFFFVFVLHSVMMSSTGSTLKHSTFLSVEKQNISWLRQIFWQHQWRRFI